MVDRLGGAPGSLRLLVVEVVTGGYNPRLGNPSFDNNAYGYFCPPLPVLHTLDLIYPKTLGSTKGIEISPPVNSNAQRLGSGVSD